jgi:hypothetical protein
MEKLEESFEYQHPEKNLKVKARVKIDRQKHFLGFKELTSIDRDQKIPQIQGCKIGL